MPDIQLREYTGRIREWIDAGRYDEAIAHCRHVLALFPGCIEVTGLLGLAYEAKEMLPEAAAALQRVLEADPELAQARIALARVFEAQGKAAAAIWQLERALDLSPDDLGVRQDLLRLYGQRDESVHTGLPLGPAALGHIYAHNGQPGRAITEYQAALLQDPHLPDARAGLIEAFWREGRRLEAVAASLDLLRVMPRCIKANLILGQIYHSTGLDGAAAERWAVAQALDPENRMAHEIMAYASPLPLREATLPEWQTEPDAATTQNLQDAPEPAEPAPGSPAEPAAGDETPDGGGAPLDAAEMEADTGERMGEAADEPGPTTAQSPSQYAGEDENVRPDAVEPEPAAGEARVPAAEEPDPGAPPIPASEPLSSEEEEPETITTGEVPEPAGWQVEPEATAAEEVAPSEPAPVAEEAADAAGVATVEETTPTESAAAAPVPDWVRRMEASLSRDAPPPGLAVLSGGLTVAAGEPTPEQAANRARMAELERQIAAQPRSFRARMELARRCTAERDWNGAILQYEELVSGRKLLPAVIGDLAALLEEAIDKVQIYRLLGDAYWESDQNEQALEMYRLARQMHRKP